MCAKEIIMSITFYLLEIFFFFVKNVLQKMFFNKISKSLLKT